MTKDRIFGLCLLVLCALLWFVIIPAQTEGAEEAFVPRLTVLFIALPSLILFLRPGGAREHRAEGDALAVFLKATLPAIALFLAFVIGTGIVGFFASALIFSVCALFLFGERRASVFVLTPPLLLGAVYLVIVHLLKFSLPEGMLF